MLYDPSQRKESTPDLCPMQRKELQEDEKQGVTPCLSPVNCNVDLLVIIIVKPKIIPHCSLIPPSENISQVIYFQPKSHLNSLNFVL